jgi:Asp-tRNA(Asn)/Glu-tRNA(Gln) amidotransferase A subunit family amidase
VNGLTVLPAVELLSMLRREQISPLELAEEHIAQIERLNPHLHALVDFDAERVRVQARALQESDNPRGPLFGLPMTIKSSIATAGYRCEIGSLLHRGNKPRENATVVERLKRAGALILGTTNCPEFLMAYETDNRLYGRTANPWDLERTSGGSSGGESAAVAAGLSAAGMGSDSGGSVREPAHFTGICSLKPTPGRIPARGHLPACDGPFAILGAIGPMARTVRDLTLLFITLSGQDSLDPVSPPVSFKNESLEDLKRVPIGFFEDDGIIPVTPETRQAVQDATRSLQSQGFHVRPFRPQALEEARQLWWTFFVRGGAMLLGPLVKDLQSKLSPTFVDFLSIAEREPPLSAQELLSAWMDCDRVRRKLLAEMERFPILLCPVCAIPAFRHGERSWDVDGQQVQYLDAMRYTQWFNLLGAPAAVVPVGRSPEGLPIGVQIAGRPFEDERVLGIAAAVEARYGYTPPPLGIP